MKHYYVYILTNVSRASLYTGVTSKLPSRYFQHKTKFYSGFTARYNISRLVYCEMFLGIDNAIAREKEIKGWTRKKKIALIESVNPKWDDLSAQWADAFKPEPRSFVRVSRLGENRREPSLAQDDTLREVFEPFPTHEHPSSVRIRSNR